MSRTICDPTNTATACFSSQASNLLQGFDFCCLTNALMTLVADVATALVELTYHLVSNTGAEFFIFIDNQPFTGVFVEDLVEVATCAVSILSLIPDVGPPLKNLLIEVVRYILATLNYVIRTVLALASLPYFVIQLPGTPDFVSKTNEALDAFVAIQQRLVAETPTSAINSLCMILNRGFPLPPTPDCDNCNPAGFIPLTKRKRRTFGDDDWSEGWRHDKMASPVTPIIYYPSLKENVTSMLLLLLFPSYCCHVIVVFLSCCCHVVVAFSFCCCSHC